VSLRSSIGAAAAPLRWGHSRGPNGLGQSGGDVAAKFDIAAPAESPSRRYDKRPDSTDRHGTGRCNRKGAGADAVARRTPLRSPRAYPPTLDSSIGAVGESTVRAIDHADLREPDTEAEPPRPSTNANGHSGSRNGRNGEDFERAGPGHLIAHQEVAGSHATTDALLRHLDHDRAGVAPHCRRRPEPPVGRGLDHQRPADGNPASLLVGTHRRNHPIGERSR
jgi:hypothetical protein